MPNLQRWLLKKRTAENVGPFVPVLFRRACISISEFLGLFGRHNYCLRQEQYSRHASVFVGTVLRQALPFIGLRNSLLAIALAGPEHNRVAVFRRSRRASLVRNGDVDRRHGKAHRRSDLQRAKFKRAAHARNRMESGRETHLSYLGQRNPRGNNGEIELWTMDAATGERRSRW